MTFTCPRNSMYFAYPCNTLAHGLLLFPYNCLSLPGVSLSVEFPDFLCHQETLRLKMQ